VGVIIARAVTLHAGGEDSGCVVGKPSFTGLGKSSPSLGQELRQAPADV
jgi:hypothetical protein